MDKKLCDKMDLNLFEICHPSRPLDKYIASLNENGQLVLSYKKRAYHCC